MKEGFGDIWKFPGVQARVITTNGNVTKDGDAVMGKGVAKQAKQRFPEIEKTFGNLLTKGGNHVYILAEDDKDALVSFPTKHNWQENSDIYLIIQSAKELVALADSKGWKRVVLPRPGCGNGGLYWPHVKTKLQNIFDDRFYVVYK